jgi:hypothetical protein
METNDEIAQLKKDVARLKQQMADLMACMNVEVCDELPTKPKMLNLRCVTITVVNPDNPNQIQGQFVGNAEGPYLSLWGSDERARFILKVEADGAMCEMFGKGLLKAVEISADDQTGRGQVGVMEQGKPRALLKAAETGGAVSVLHDDNHPRVLLHANDQCGELMAVNQDLKTTVKITSDGLHGGMLTVHGMHGRPLVALCGSKPCGIVLIKDEKANVIASLPAAPQKEEEDE